MDHVKPDGLTMQDSTLYPRLSSAFDFIVRNSRILVISKPPGSSAAKPLSRATCSGIVLGSLALRRLLFGPHRIFYLIANVSIIATLILVAARSIGEEFRKSGSSGNPPRPLIFVAFVLWENIRSVLGLWFRRTSSQLALWRFWRTLGYVAARQTLQRDQQLSEIQRELK